MPEGLKVLFVGPYYVPGSITSLTGEHISNIFRDLYDSIESYCEKIYMLTMAGVPEQVEEEFARFEKLHVVRIPKDAFISGRGFMSHFNLIREGVRLVRSENIGIVTNSTGEVSYGFDAALIGNYAGIRSVLRVPGNSILSTRRSGGYSSFRRPKLYLDRFRRMFAYKWADSVIVMSPAERDRVIRFAGDPRKVHVCPRGIDTERFSVHPRAGGERKVFNVFFVGRHSEEKGFDIALDVAEILKGDQEVLFTFVGGHDAGISGNITFRGPVHSTKIHEVYADADIVIMPSRNEGLPQVLLEAMSSGRAVIASRHVYERLVPDDVVMLCENTPHAFAEGIRRLIGDPGAIERLGHKAREFVEKEYGRKRYQDLYWSIISGKT